MSCKYCKEKCDTCIHSYCEMTIGVLYRRNCLSDNLSNYKPCTNYCHACGKSLTELKPLTLKELKAHDGKPIWVITPQTGENYWAIARINQYNVNLYRNISGDSGEYELYGVSWFAYDRQPKEG